VPAYKCPFCGVLAEFILIAQANDQRNWSHFVSQCRHCGRAVYSATWANDPDQITYPTGRAAPSQDLPAEVRDCLDEAIKSLDAGAPKASALMTRSAIQAAMRQQQANGKTLWAEIEDLAERNVLPPALREWAHEIRDGANPAAHPKDGEQVTREDGLELLALAEALFEYLYIVPADITRRRARSKAQDAS